MEEIEFRVHKHEDKHAVQTDLSCQMHEWWEMLHTTS